MSDALDRIAPEDKKGELYRHSAEGLDDMPVCALSIRSYVFRGSRRGFRHFSVQRLIILGTYQIGIGGSKCYHSHHKWKVKYRNMARNLVSGVQVQQA